MAQTHGDRVYQRLEDADWANWTPQERATLLFVIRDHQMLLIHKKRGLGTGKIDGPGGRLDAGESPLHGAIREVQEELNVTPTGVQPCGELAFQFADGFSMLVYIFTAKDCEGEPRETDEAAPLWVPLTRIPYGSMWADDPIWFPLMLAGKQFQGGLLFGGETLLGHQVAMSPWRRERMARPVTSDGWAISSPPKKEKRRGDKGTLSDPTIRSLLPS
jgi:8-oxo-dGTP diphosphatase